MTAESLRRHGIGRVVVLGRSLPPETPPLGDWHLATVLARHLPVVYVAPPTWPSRTTSTGRRFALSTSRVGDLEVARPIAPPGSDRAGSAVVGDLLLSRQLGRYLGPSAAQDTLLVISDPRRGPLPGLPRRLTVYWRRDRFAHHGGTVHVAHLAARDRALMHRADLVVGISPALAEEAEQTGSRAVYVPNGCDVEHFTSPPLRSWRPGVRPRVGFVGGLSWRIDGELLAELAHRRPDWDVHVYGPGSTELPRHRNLIVHGAVSYPDLPDVMGSLHVGLIPYRDNAFNRASLPLKTFEYLAAGVPVVSSDIPALAAYTPYVQRARSVAEFEDTIVSQLEPPFTLEAARSFAALQSWDQRGATFLRAAAEVAAQTPSSGRRPRWWGAYDGATP